MACFGEKETRAYCGYAVRTVIVPPSLRALGLAAQRRASASKLPVLPAVLKKNTNICAVLPDYHLTNIPRPMVLYCP